jgi:hypothetical protein
MLLGASGYQPDEVAALTAILEHVWARLKHRYIIQERDAVRERLASIILQHARQGLSDEPEVFEAWALLTFEESIERSGGLSMNGCGEGALGAG